MRNILRHTDNHNSALLKKEAEESRLRLQNLSNSHSQRPAQQLYSARDRHNPKRRRLDLVDDRNKSDQKPHSHRRPSPDARATHSRSHRRHESPDRSSSHPSRRDRRSPDSKRHESTRHRSSSPRNRHTSTRHRSRSPRNRHSSTRPSKSSEDATRHRRAKHSPQSDASDSDPLDAIIGPAPPSNPPVRSRGRGTQNHASAIDSHFSSNYDPSADVQPDPQEDDDWDQALEALRDRQKWKQQGADRLRAAGFTEKEVSKWEKGGEKSEEDVVWTKKGEGREWDRGKVVDEHGSVDVKPEWGRLKDP